MEKELMFGREAEEMTEARKEARRAPRAANMDWCGDKDKARAQGTGQGHREGARVHTPLLLRLRRARTYPSELSIQVD